MKGALPRSVVEDDFELGETLDIAVDEQALKRHEKATGGIRNRAANRKAARVERRKRAGVA